MSRYQANYETRALSFAAESGQWAIANTMGLVANMPWVPILSAIMTLAPSLFRYLEAKAKERTRVRELTAELVDARARLEAMKNIHECGGGGSRS